jgi:phosphoglycolate phosphatase
VSRLAVFDLDGTLVDSLADLTASVNHALRTVRLPTRTEDEVRGFVGEGARLLVSRAVGPHPELLDAALAAWQVHYAQHLLDRTRPFPGVEDLLAGAGRPLAVLTNKPTPLARRILSGLGLLPHFVDVVGGGDAPRKPDPAGLLAIMARTGASAVDTVLVGDSAVDLATGRAAGVAVVGVTWGLARPGDLHGAAARVDRVRDLEPWLR